MDFEQKYQKDPGMNRVKREFTIIIEIMQAKQGRIIFVEEIQRK